MSVDIVIDLEHEANAQGAQCKPCLLEIVPIPAVERMNDRAMPMQPARAQRS
jgi:hypothetical protein